MRFLFLLLILPALAPAQNLLGHWVGRLSVADSTLPFELMISGNEEKPEGYEQITFRINGFDNIGVKKISLKRKSNSVTIEDFELVYNNYQVPPKPVKLYAKLALSSNINEQLLTGSFYTRSQNIRDPLNVFSKGEVWLTKAPEEGLTTVFIQKLNELNLLAAKAPASADVAAANKSAKPEKSKKTKSSADLTIETATAAAAPPVEKKQTESNKRSAEKKAEKEAAKTQQEAAAANKKIASPSTVAAIIDPSSRLIEIIDSVWIDSDSVTITLYDNGEIDGDTVSVLLNNNLLLNRVGLSANPVSLLFCADIIGSDSTLLVLYPNNLGSIAPNTGLLILQNGSNRYSIGFSGDLQRNPAILLRHRHRSQ